MPTFIKRGAQWQAQVRLAGFPGYAETFESKQAAQDWAADKEAELRASRKRTVRGSGRTTVADLVRAYLADPATKALRSFDDTEARLTHFAADTTALRDFGPIQIIAKRDDLRTGKRTASTVNRIMSCMRSAHSWGTARGMTDRPWPSHVMLPEPHGRTRFLTNAEIAELLKAAKDDVLLDVAIRVSLATGMRQGELLALNWQDIDLAKGTATIHRSKTDRKRVVRLTNAGVAALKRLRGDKVQALSGAIFLTPSGTRIDMFALAKRWRPIRTSAGLSDFHWHDMRHTCASVLAQKGASLLEIGSLLGHSSMSTTLRYAHLIPGASIKGQKALSDLLS